MALNCPPPEARLQSCRRAGREPETLNKKPKNTMLYVYNTVTKENSRHRSAEAAGHKFNRLKASLEAKAQPGDYVALLWEKAGKMIPLYKHEFDTGETYHSAAMGRILAQL